MHLLIIGAGSVGRRHARNFAQLGSKISCFDPRAERNAQLASEAVVAAQFDSLERALGSGEYDGAVVCSPPHVHVSQTEACLRAGLPVLLEKPISPGLTDALHLRGVQQNLGGAVLLGYTWRWWSPLARVRQLVATGRIGALRHVRFVMSAHLADWHPWEPYQEFFMARRDLGGGALLDESHWIDLACWMFGSPLTVLAQVEKISDLEIDSDDNVDMLLTYPNGLKIYLHLDLYGRPHEKSITFVGEGGTIRWSAEPNQILVGSQSSRFEDIETFAGERNDMFLAVAREFLEVIAGRSPACSLSDGVDVLRIVEAARTSNSLRRAVALAEIPI